MAWNWLNLCSCPKCNYKPQATSLAAKIKQALDTKPVLIPKGGGIFDVSVEDQLVYSKFKTGSFPDENQLIDELVSTYGRK